MVISDWDRDFIRRRLNNYRTANSINGRLQSLNIFLTHLLISGVTKQGYTYDGDSDFKVEALRRFVKGISRLEDDKVFAIQQFLIHKKFLKEEELGCDIDAEYLPRLLAVHDYLGNTTEHALFRISHLKESYYAEIVNGSSIEKIQLNILLNKSHSFFRVEEIFETNIDYFMTSITYDTDSGTTSKKIRKGYGFMSTDHFMLYLFLHDGTDNNPISYIQVEMIVFGLEPLTLMRSGVPVTIAYPKTHDPDQPIILNNIYSFSTDSENPFINKVHATYPEKRH